VRTRHERGATAAVQHGAARAGPHRLP
jgi:hypothetical protein